MCGIAAIFSLTERSVPSGWIKAMTDVVRHRGPDDEGYVVFHRQKPGFTMLGGKDTPSLVYDSHFSYSPSRLQLDLPEKAFGGLGHRRLSVIDVSATGHQPMGSEDGRYWIVYNGEVYNYIELRKELASEGSVFQSNSDTEVILNAYRHWGGDCLNRFNGMFALVLFDLKERRIFAARDRYGIKPLYYWFHPVGFLAFASEIKQFMALPDFAARVNGQRAYDFLAWSLLDHTSETLFAGVRQLRGGEYILSELDKIDGRLPTRRWYTLSPHRVQGDLRDMSSAFKQIFIDSIKLRLRADVPVGSCLSGGLDSSSIVCLANTCLRDLHLEYLQKTFSAFSEIRDYDESAFVREVIKKTNVETHTTCVKFENLPYSLNSVTWHQDEPFESTSVYAQWEVFKLAAQAKMKVLLDGQGADETLAGYNSFFGFHFATLFRTLQWKLLWSEIERARNLHRFSAALIAQKILDVLLPEIIRQPLKGLAGKSTLRPNWLSMKTLKAEAIDPSVDHSRRPSNIHEFSIAQLTTLHLPMLLHWEDRNSMAHSIESRLPFLDYRLVEFILGLPDAHRLSEGWTKRVLREAMDGTLPEKVRMRVDKMGFVTAEEHWVRRSAPSYFRSELERAIQSSRGILKDDAKDKLERMISSQEKFSSTVWRMISFGKWMEEFRVEPPCL